MKKATKDVKALMYTMVKLEGTKYTMMIKPWSLRGERTITKSEGMWLTKHRRKLVEQNIPANRKP